MGPDFLYKSKGEWPKFDIDLQVIPDTDPEIKRLCMLWLKTGTIL